MYLGYPSKSLDFLRITLGIPWYSMLRLLRDITKIARPILAAVAYGWVKPSMLVVVKKYSLVCVSETKASFEKYPKEKCSLKLKLHFSFKYLGYVSLIAKLRIPKSN